MSTRLNPRLGLALLVVLGLSVFVATQPSPDDDLAVQGRERQDHASAVAGNEASPVRPLRVGDAGPAGAPRSDGASRPGTRAARAASTPTPAQATALAAWAGAWAHRASAPWAPPSADARWSWSPQQPPAPPPPPPQEAPAPTAPVFPYAWVGRFVDEAPQAVIAGPNGTWVLRKGEVIEGQWRLDSIDERRLTVTYLPLSQEQTVALK